MSARAIVIADFLRVEIEEGWREIREPELLDPPVPADLPTPPPGAEKFEFRGICADCASRVESFRQSALGPRRDYEYYKKGGKA